MGGAEGAVVDQGLFGVGQPHNRMDFGGLQGLLVGHVRENGGESLGQHGLSGTRYTSHKDIMTSCGSDFQSSFDLSLSPVRCRTS